MNLIISIGGLPYLYFFYKEAKGANNNGTAGQLDLKDRKWRRWNFAASCRRTRIMIISDLDDYHFYFRYKKVISSSYESTGKEPDFGSILVAVGILYLAAADIEM